MSSLVDLYRKRLLPVASALRQVEMNGFHYDVVEAANLNEREVLPKLHKLTRDLRGICKHDLINPRSPTQISALWYGEWGLRHELRDSGKKKFSHSAAREVREEIMADRFICKPGLRETIKEFNEAYHLFQKIDKQRGTYIEGLIYRTLADGRIYCSFNEGGTVTGRASSSDPNLQNITREGPEGTDIPGIRTLFLPSPGNVIVSADFSQAELRTCAYLSGDRNLRGIYSDSTRSLHKERAAAFYGVGYTKEQYVRSKNINFGVTYGQSAKAFAQMYHMPEREAQSYISAWWQEFPQLLAWTREIKKIVHSSSAIVESPFGHRRRFHLITADNVGDAEREAVNFIPQNVAAWLTLMALSELVLEHDVRVVCTVHDSIVADVPEDKAYEVAALMQTVMQNQPEKQLGWTDVPFTADVSIGVNWGQLEEIEISA